MKLCKDCKHFTQETSDGLVISSICLRHGFGVDMVTGATTWKDPLNCYGARNASNDCGEDAKYWEPK